MKYFYIKIYSKGPKQWCNNNNNNKYKTGQKNKENNNHSWTASLKGGKRKEGKKGLMQTKGTYVAEIIKLVAYVENNKDPLIQTCRTHP